MIIPTRIISLEDTGQPIFQLTGYSQILSGDIYTGYKMLNVYLHKVIVLRPVSSLFCSHINYSVPGIINFVNGLFDNLIKTSGTTILSERLPIV